MDLQHLWACTSCISVTPQRITIFSCTKERTYIGAVQLGASLDFLKNWENDCVSPVSP